MTRRRPPTDCPYTEAEIERSQARLAAVLGPAVKEPPYPFCRTPQKCAGKGYCPNDPACNN